MKHEYAISYKRVQLQSLTWEDAEKMRQLRNRNSSKFFDTKEISEEMQKKWYANYLKAENDYMFSVYLKDSNEWIGAVSIYNVDLENETGEFGRLLIGSEKIRGLGVDATVAACKFAFEQLGIKMVHLEVYADNIPAVKTYKKAGFKLCKAKNAENKADILYMEKNI